MIEVIATRKGLYGGRMRQRGDEFTVEKSSEFSTRWMIKRGTPEFEAFKNGLTGEGNLEDQAVEAEKIAVGGINEQLSIALTENQTLKETIAELQTEVAVLRDQTNAEPVPPITPAPEVADGQTAGGKGGEESKGSGGTSGGTGNAGNQGGGKGKSKTAPARTRRRRS